MTNQNDFVIDNGTGLAVRQDIQDALQALAGLSSGDAAPSTTYAFQLYANTSTDMLQIRNAANSAFIDLFQLDGTFTLEDGSASTPALAARNDLNTGVFFSAADKFNISTGGVERVEFGTTTIFNEDGADVDFRIEGDTEANLFYVDAGNDRIGIGGTTTPDTILEITDGGTEPRLVRIHNSSTNGSAIQFTNTDTGNSTNQGLYVGLDAAGHGNFYHQSNFALIFATNNDERMRLDESGRLLLGTTTEGSANADDLTIATSADTGMTIRSGTSNAGSIFFSDATSGNAEFAGFVQYLHNNNSLSFGTDETTRMTIDNSGNVNIADGNLVIGTAGHGIDFSATADTGGVGTMTSELFDDYEEGTFTPEVTSGLTSPTYSIQRGGYTKIGRMVYFQIDISISGGTRNSDHFKIGGLPYNSKAASGTAYGGAFINYQNGFLGKGEDVSLHIGLNDNAVKFYKHDGSNAIGTSTTAFADVTANPIINGFYCTD